MTLSGKDVEQWLDRLASGLPITFYIKFISALMVIHALYFMLRSILAFSPRMDRLLRYGCLITDDPHHAECAAYSHRWPHSVDCVAARANADQPLCHEDFGACECDCRLFDRAAADRKAQSPCFAGAGGIDGPGYDVVAGGDEESYGAAGGDGVSGRGAACADCLPADALLSFELALKIAFEQRKNSTHSTDRSDSTYRQRKSVVSHDPMGHNLSIKRALV